jgi:GT2 family glycosyltransferase
MAKNLGVAAGRNLLIRDTRERWLFFVDNDVTIATRRWSALFRAHGAAHPRAEVFRPSLFNVHDGGYVRAPRCR